MGDHKKNSIDNLKSFFPLFIELGFIITLTEIFKY